MRLEQTHMTSQGRTWGFRHVDTDVELRSNNGTNMLECYARNVGDTGSFAHRGARPLHGESARTVAVQWAREITGRDYE